MNNLKSLELVFKSGMKETKISILIHITMMRERGELFASSNNERKTPNLTTNLQRSRCTQE